LKEIVTEMELKRMEELEEIKKQFKEDSFNGHWLKGYQIKWLIEQAEMVEQLEERIELLERKGY
jgi:hypothetical protein